MLLHISGFPSFIRLNNILLHVCTTFFIIHSSVNGRPDCFYILAIVNSTPMNMGVVIYFCDPDFHSFG